LGKWRLRHIIEEEALHSTMEMPRMLWTLGVFDRKFDFQLQAAAGRQSVNNQTNDQ
jgi:hypothetical protein